VDVTIENATQNFIDSYKTHQEILGSRLNCIVKSQKKKKVLGFFGHDLDTHGSTLTYDYDLCDWNPCTCIHIWMLNLTEKSSSIKT
jgi:hypothetical protein